MIDVSDADRLLAAIEPPREVVTVALAESWGRVLEEEIRADRDCPPFDRVCMDGYAVDSRDLDGGSEVFRVAASARAGAPPAPAPGRGECIEVMTGAVLPVGCDLVIPYEETLESGAGSIRLDRLRPHAPGRNVQRAGAECAAGAVVLSQGTRIGACEAGILASFGRSRVQVRGLPRIALVSTGDELVAVESVPLPHQIRRSNAWALHAALARRGFHDIEHIHLPDDRGHLERGFAELLERCAIVIVSGGVSMGRWDLVPSALESVGIEALFHKIRQRPGKPLWFGTGRAGRIVVGLPGNPVSTLVCCARYVLPLLERACGCAAPRERAVLAAGIPPLAGPTRFVPVRLEGVPGARIAHLVATRGSGDFVALAGTDGFVQVDPGATPQVGEPIEVWPW